MRELQTEIYLTSLVVLVATLSILFYQKMSSRRLVSVDFEVFGYVQGVFFRKFTERHSKTLGLRGWCMNTENGTVQGSLQGEETAINCMKQWLKETGSPRSLIDRCEFSNEKEIQEFSFTGFKIRQ